jgi:CRISPR type I-A-associated protein Csa5
MLQREAFGALQELNKIIYHKNLSSLLVFPRLYSQETSTNNFVNLLYPETAKYLLKEVAMIRQDIIENQAIGSLARTLRYFVRDRKYHYADDIRNARQESKAFEETIAKMLREGRLRRGQKEEIHLPTENEMKEVFRLANEYFEDVKTTLVILAFSFSSKAEEEIEEDAKTSKEVQNA